MVTRMYGREDVYPGDLVQVSYPNTSPPAEPSIAEVLSVTTDLADGVQAVAIVWLEDGKRMMLYDGTSENRTVLMREPGHVLFTLYGTVMVVLVEESRASMRESMRLLTTELGVDDLARDWIERTVRK